MNGLCKRLRLQTVGAITLLLLGTGPFKAIGQHAHLPDVTSASVPLYPKITQLAHIEGAVRLRISTDGNRVASVEIQSGQPMLAKAAEENVKTWQFEQHSPTAFEVTFRYRLSPSRCDAECNCDSSERPSVLLQLPTEVEVNAKELLVCGAASSGSRP